MRLHFTPLEFGWQVCDVDVCLKGRATSGSLGCTCTFYTLGSWHPPDALKVHQLIGVLSGRFICVEEGSMISQRCIQLTIDIG